MARYRKKPVVIEAWRWTPPTIYESPPEWLDKAIIAGTIFQNLETHPPCVMIDTLEGRMRAEVGDWIIRGVKGEIYPIKPDIFNATYEAVE